jgi:branched-subunit amino acid transport protein
MRFLHLLVGALVAPPPPRDQRGLSQSTENAILLAGAVAVALIVISAVTIYVTAKLPRP